MLQGNNILIRAIKEEDLRQIFSWNTQKGRGDYQEFEFSSFQSFTQNFNSNGFITSEHIMLMIEDIKGTNLGLAYITFRQTGVVSIGLEIKEANYRGYGYGSEALALIVEYIFNNYPIARIQADTDIANNAAQRALENFGFTKEGTLRSYRYHHGEWHDSLIYSLLRSEYTNK